MSAKNISLLGKVILVQRASLLVTLLFGLILLSACEKNSPEESSEKKSIGMVDSKIIELSIKSSLDENLKEFKDFPKAINIADEEYQFKYFINKRLEDRIKQALRRWDSKNAAVAVIDNKTGGVIAAVGYQSSDKSFNRNLVFSSTHPAASIVKIITASNMIEGGKINYGTNFHFNGKSTTLYKSQLENTKNKWSAKTDFATAFSFSNNVVFGKAILLYSSNKKMHKTAEAFGFGKKLMKYVTLGESKLFMAKTNYELAELATGFNKRTLISPIHAAVLASTIVRGGDWINPQVVKTITKNKKVIWAAKNQEPNNAISFGTARQLKTMMKKVVKSGTARKIFRRYPSKILKQLEIAGKTGSITGGIPYGKRDWFVSYGKKLKSTNPGISVAVMLVHGADWKVRSTLIAKNVYEFYFRDLK